MILLIVYSRIIFVAFLLRSSYGISSSTKDVRYNDEPFSNELTVLGRNVTCGEHNAGQFPSETWSCHDMRIDGNRLIFTYSPGTGASKMACGEDVGRNDIAQLCRHLLEMRGNKHKLWSAYVSKASCGSSAGPRMVFRRTANGTYQWDTVTRGRGYIKSMECMVMDT